MEKNILAQSQVKDTPITKGGSLSLNGALIITEAIGNSLNRRRIPPLVVTRRILGQSSPPRYSQTANLYAILEDENIHANIS